MTLSVVVGFSALTLDISSARSSKGEAQAAADAAALNGANGLSDNTFAAKALAAAAENKVGGVAVNATALTSTAGNWSNNTFTANGSPRNAIRCLVERTKAKGNAISGIFSQGLGWPMPDVKATCIVALVNQSDYEWGAKDSIDLVSNNNTTIAAMSSTSPGNAQTKTTLRTDGDVKISGNGTVKADIKYGTNTNISGAVNVTGNLTDMNVPMTYPTASQVANIAGVTPVFTASYPLTVNTSQSIPGGVYSVTTATVLNATLTFSGPATIVVSGNLTIDTAGFKTFNNLPANLKIISTGTGTITIKNPSQTLNADFYAPNSALILDSSTGYGLQGRGLFKSIKTSGSTPSLVYDTNLTTTSLARKAVVVR